MNQSKEPLKVESNQMELVDFRIYQRQTDGSVYEGIYGINVSKVREIIVMPACSRVPDAHPAIEGIFQLRGIQVPAINLASWLGLDEALPEDMTRKIVVAEFGHYTVGFIIHHAHRIRRIAWIDIHKPPALVSQRHGASIVGTTLIDEDQTLLLIDVEKVISEMAGKSVEETLEEEFAGQDLNRHHAHILIVDDSSVARKQLSVSLGKVGYRVTEASDGREALKWLREADARALEAGLGVEGEVQLVVTDVEMPRMDGYTLTAHIKKDERLGILPVIMHSSLAGQANLEKGRKAGCDEYIVKFEPKVLLDIVGRYATTFD